MRESVDLFDTTYQWQGNPREAFLAFVQSVEFVKAGRRIKPGGETDELRPLRSSSVTVYMAMFERFLSWLESRQLNLFNISHLEIKTFLDLKEQGRGLRLTSKIRTVYIRLLERVYTHLNIHPNPASKVVLDPVQGFRRGKENDKAFLSQEQIGTLISHLPPAPTWNSQSSLKRQRGWEKRRNRAMIALLIGAGLKVSEVATLRLPGIAEKDQDGTIPIELNHWDGTGSGRAHRPVVQAFAVAEVESWLLERRKMDVSSELVFPADLEQGAALSLPTIYRQVNQALQAAGIDATHMGGRTLRNTYAAQQLAGKVDIELVGERLGHRDKRATEMYQSTAEKFRGNKS